MENLLDDDKSKLRFISRVSLLFFYVLQKKREREGAILRSSQRTKWLSVTSEESGDDDFIVLHPLPWRSAYITKMFSKIDAYIISKKSSQAKRQMKCRRLGDPSCQPRDAPDWAINYQ